MTEEEKSNYLTVVKAIAEQAELHFQKIIKEIQGLYDKTMEIVDSVREPETKARFMSMPIVTTDALAEVEDKRRRFYELVNAFEHANASQISEQDVKKIIESLQ